MDTDKYPRVEPGSLDTGSEAFMMISSGLVFMMVPALAIFYGGMVSKKAVINTMLMSFQSLSVGSIFFSIIGYSMAFGPAGPLSPFWGGLGFGAFDSSDSLRHGTSISEHTYFAFQLSFQSITIAVISGAVVTKITVWAFVVFSVLWSAFVYTPLAFWIFNSEGWLAQWGVLDFAGGLVVETSSGVSAFVLAYWLGGKPPGQRAAVATMASPAAVGAGSTAINAPPKAPSGPHNLPLTLLGAGFLWIGWYGFNAGSAIASGFIAGRAFVNTHLAASSAMAAFSFAQYVWDGNRFFTGKPTALGAANGAIIGLVAITPACGFISQMAALLLGVLAAILSYWAERNMKHYTGVDDRLDCLPVHGLAGAFGILYVGLFASEREDSPTNGAFYGGGGLLLGKQTAALAITVALCVLNTSLSYWIVAGIGRLLGWPLRVSEEDEDNIDEIQHGDSAYGQYTDDEGGARLLGSNE